MLAVSMLAAPVLTALMLSGCATPQALTIAVRPAVPDPKTQMGALEQRIYTLSEAAREKIDPKAPRLKLDKELSEVAREHSQDMAAKNYMAHKAPNGETSATIIMARDANFQGLLGENIAAEYYTKEQGVDADVFAGRFINTWLNSEKHRENLADPEYDLTGVGAAVNGGTVYVTQLFAAKLDLPVPEPKRKKKKAPKPAEKELRGSRP